MQENLDLENAQTLTKAKKPKFIIISKIVSLVFLAVTLYMVISSVDAFIKYLQPESGLGEGIGMALMLVFVLIIYLPANVISLTFSILGLIKSVKFYKGTQVEKGKIIDRVFFITLIAVLGLTLSFAIFIFVYLKVIGKN